MGQNQRTYTLEQASTELNIAPETLTRLLEKAGFQHTGRDAQNLTEDEVNRLLSILQSDTEFSSTTANQSSR